MKTIIYILVIAVILIFASAVFLAAYALHIFRHMDRYMDKRIKEINGQ